MVWCFEKKKYHILYGLDDAYLSTKLEMENTVDFKVFELLKG